jgi:hypothetical protein
MFTWSIAERRRKDKRLDPDRIFPGQNFSQPFWRELIERPMRLEA